MYGFVNGNCDERYIQIANTIRLSCNLHPTPNMNNSPPTKIIFIGLVVLLSVISSCGKEEAPQAIHPELQPYVTAFESEAMKRGIVVEIDGLNAQIVEGLSSSAPVCGVSLREDVRGFPAIEIDKDCWETYPESDKEVLVFHELGHAVLGRSDTDDYLDFEIKPKSIMTTRSLIKLYNTSEGPMREYYIDELFDSNTPFPYSFRDKNLSRTLLEEDFSVGLDGWQFFVDGEEIEDWENDPRIDISSVNNSGASSINFSNQDSEGDWILFLKRFEIDNFSTCSNLLATGDVVKTQGSDFLFINMGLSLRERDVNGNLNRFSFEENGVNDTLAEFADDEVFEDFQVANYCIPVKTDLVTVSFSLWSNSMAEIRIENVRVELYE